MKLDSDAKLSDLKQISLKISVMRYAAPSFERNLNWSGVRLNEHRLADRISGDIEFILLQELMGQFKTNDIFQIASRHYSEQLWVAGLLSFADFQRQLAPPDYMNWCDIREILSLSWQDAAETRSALITCRRVETDLQLRCHDIQVYSIFRQKDRCILNICNSCDYLKKCAKLRWIIGKGPLELSPQRETFQRHLWI